MNTKNHKEKVYHAWTLFCGSSSVDAENNSLSLFNLVENINVEMVINDQQMQIYKEKGWYAVPLNLQLVTKVQRENMNTDVKFNASYKIFDPNNKEIGKEFGNEVIFPKGIDSIRIRNIIADFPLTVSGLYRLTFNLTSLTAKDSVTTGEMFTKINIDIKK